MRMKIIKEKVLSLRSKLIGSDGIAAFACPLAIVVGCALLTGCGDANVSLVKKEKFPGHAKESIDVVMNRNFDDASWNSGKENGKTKVTFSGTVSANAHDVKVNNEQLDPFYEKIKARKKKWEANPLFKKCNDLQSKAEELRQKKRSLKRERENITSDLGYYKRLKKIEDHYAKRKKELTREMKQKIKNRPKQHLSESDWDGAFQSIQENLDSEIQSLKYSYPKVCKKKKSELLAKSSKLLAGLQAVDRNIALVDKETEKANKMMLTSKTQYKNDLAKTQKELNRVKRKMNMALQKKMIWPVGRKVQITWIIHPESKKVELSEIHGLTITDGQLYNATEIIRTLIVK